MSKTNPDANATRAASLPAVLKAARRLALVAETLASVVTACAVRRAYRGLAALDDRLLADIGLDRATVENLAANSLRETWTSRAQVTWHRSHTSA
jgi:uncharacterized protein YjiS (DUF1127 family)